MNLVYLIKWFSKKHLPLKGGSVFLVLQFECGVFFTSVSRCQGFSYLRNLIFIVRVPLFEIIFFERLTSVICQNGDLIKMRLHELRYDILEQIRKAAQWLRVWLFVFVQNYRDMTNILSSRSLKYHTTTLCTSLFFSNTL